MDNITTLTFGQHFKELRKQAGLTQSDCFGVPLRTVQNWESGFRTPPEWLQNLLIEKLETLTTN